MIWELLNRRWLSPSYRPGGADAYLTLAEKAAVLCFSISGNHPFVDGNKRVAHAAMEVFLVLNSAEIEAPVDDQENLMLKVAAGEITREGLVQWLELHVCASK